ncbi:Cell surface mannoprotein MP65 [Sphaceloma murrayae]|uniref:Probable beta-glucosidase btgE n=1 Tax=Sphaceloma murrayae TaxID=2082308 RepID=A0A2K1QYX6_9PEZI|nr:Cell surface mannoprotein MP65 [Sphaceloma murrayae]
MKYSTLLSLASSTLSLAAPAKLQPLRTRSIDYIPPDLYASPDPSFAGAPIVLSSPPPPPSSLSPGPGRYAMTYTPYTSDGLCKTSETVSSDISRISSAGFSAVRLYATDCHAVHSVGAAALNSSLQLILGMHVSDSGTNSTSIVDQISHIVDFMTQSPAHLSAIDLVVVGNEAIFNEYANAPSIAALVNEVRKTLRQIDYQGPVTTAEPYGTFMENAETLCPAIDVVAANLLPFFHADVSPRLAGDFAAQQIDSLDGLCEDVVFASQSRSHPSSAPAVPLPTEETVQEERARLALLKKRHLLTSKGNKPVLAMEVGWPRHGKANGDAVAGVAEQRTAIAGMSESVGSRSVFSSFADDEWRDPGDFGVERSWGCVQVFE